MEDAPCLHHAFGKGAGGVDVGVDQLPRHIRANLDLLPIHQTAAAAPQRKPQGFPNVRDGSSAAAKEYESGVVLRTLSPDSGAKAFLDGEDRASGLAFQLHDLRQRKPEAILAIGKGKSDGGVSHGG
ncbi:hypothetical protein [Synechococcus phage Yong-M3-232]|nr:hypothetical protein [Synechococcus phage Yong-M3-232]